MENFDCNCLPKDELNTIETILKKENGHMIAQMHKYCQIDKNDKICQYYKNKVTKSNQALNIIDHISVCK